MNPKKHACIWLIETLMLFGIYSILCFFMPDVWLYHFYTRNFGFVTELEWSDNYTLVLFIASFFLNIICIYLFTNRKSKACKKLHNHP